jgi:hypothetical protein
MSQRNSLNGKWVLLRNRGTPSLKPFLETMGVSDLAIEANEKGDAEHDTIHDISLTSTQYSIKKLSRVNDLVLTVNLGEEQHIPLPGGAVQTVTVTSQHPGHVHIYSELPTMNGLAKVTDVKTLVQESKSKDDHEDIVGTATTTSSSSSTSTTQSVYVQHLTIVNDTTQQINETIRYFVPFEGEMEPTALTAGGNKRKNKDRQ